MMNRTQFLVTAIVVCYALSSLESRADESPDGSCPARITAGGLVISGNIPNEDVDTIGISTNEIVNLARETILFNFAEQVGIDGVEFLDKFNSFPVERRQEVFALVETTADVTTPSAEIKQKLLTFADPFYAVELNYRNTTDVTQTVSFQAPYRHEPVPFDDAVATARLELDLFDTSGDGTAELGLQFGRSGILSPDIFAGSGIANLVDPSGNFFSALGEPITGPTTETQVYDIELATLQTFSPIKRDVSEISPRIEFTISPGDEVHFRAVISVAESTELLIDPELTLQVLAQGLQLPVPEPTSASLATLSALILALNRRK